MNLTFEGVDNSWLLFIASCLVHVILHVSPQRSVNTCKARVNARSSSGTVVIIIECKDSVIIVNEHSCYIVLYFAMQGC